MARPSRLTVAKKDILALFDTAATKVYSSSQLAKILNEQRAFWRLADRTTAGEFIAFLEKQGKLKSH
ncbi:hypothetical protein, partial [Serratia marcescens]|uniref:hypothetical protein n=1 Tax=Serratia marcescens TaxID=615 RepID=UPI001954DBEC